MSRNASRCSAWIAFLAMVLNALWPVIVQAKPGQAPTLQEVCTSAGLQKFAVGSDLPAEHSSGALSSPHCAFCSLGSDRVAIPSAPLAIVVPDSGPRARIDVPPADTLPASHTRSPAQPRAPPFLS